MKAESLVMLVAGMLLGGPSVAPAQTIYQCAAHGKVTYQDTPCTGRGVISKQLSFDKQAAKASQASTKSAVPAPSGVELKSTLKTIYRKLYRLGDEVRANRAFMHMAVSSAKSKSKGLPIATRKARVLAARDQWLPKIRREESSIKELNQLIKRLCPGGAMLNEKRQMCMQE